MADKIVNLPEDWSVKRLFTDLTGNGTQYAQAMASVAVPSATVGASAARVIAAPTNNATVLKASPGIVYGIEGCNNAAYPVFLKIFDKATLPTVGTDGTILTIQIPAGGRCEINRPNGIKFTVGIGYAIVKGYQDADNTAVAAADFVGSISYF